MEYCDCDPWQVPETRCYSNVRIIRTVYVRAEGAVTARREEIIPHEHRSDVSRIELRLTVPGYGSVYLHILTWWLLFGKPKKRFNSWQAFRQSGRVVDHGDDGMPHVCDYRTLKLMPNSGKRSNSSQGAQIRWGRYASHGGLKAVVDKGIWSRVTVMRRPSGYVHKKPSKRRA